VFFDQAKAEGLLLSVSTEAAAYDIFAKLGFKDIRHVDIDLRQWAPAYSGFGLFCLE
jgi:hypothetical protein